MQYRGRFAPTPSGPLHLGSLFTALASWLDARAHGGAWLLRVDDLDAARCPPGTDAVIRRQLESHGLTWDETPRVQSGHVAEYRAALARLAGAGRLYACTCTRIQLAASSRQGPDAPVYPGTCRERSAPGRAALRLQVASGTSCFDDGWQGRQCRDLSTEVGDFVVRRADGTAAYQLACAVDEHAQGITHVVRGADLLGSTFRQLEVMQSLSLRPPAYRHLPVLTGDDGRKLSKQNHAEAVDEGAAASNLVICLALLGQRPPPELRIARPCEVLDWARAHWSQQSVPGVQQTRLTRGL